MSRKEHGEIMAIMLTALLLISMELVHAQGGVFFYGQVVDENSYPVSAAQITVYRGIYIVTSVASKNDGSFSLLVPPGSYTLVIYKRGYAPLYYTFEVFPGRGGSLGTVVLRKGVSMVPDATSISTSQGENVRLNLRIYNSCLEPLLVNFSYSAPPNWKISLVDPRGLSVNNVYLNPGENKTLAFVVSVPLNASELGVVSLFLYWANLSSRTDFTFRVAQRAWRFLTIPTAALKSFPGAQISIPVNLTSPLDFDVPVSLYLIAPPNFVATIVDESGLSVQTVLARPGTPKRLQLIIYVPPNVPLSSYAFKVIARTSFAQQVESVQVDVESSYDLLKISTGTTCLNATSGSTLSLRFILENDGNMPTVALLKAVPSSPLIRAYFSASGEALASVYVSPGEKKALTLIADIDRLLPPGMYLVTLYANGSTSITSREITIQVTGTRRIDVLNTNFKVVGRPGSVATFKLLLANNGTLSVNDVFLQVDSPSSDIRVSINPAHASLPPNTAVSFEISIYISPNATEGFYNIPVTIISGELKMARIIVLEIAAGEGFSYPLLAAGLFVSCLAVVRASRARAKKTSKNIPEK
jgi:uncharacterized membrane protein